MVIYVSWLHRLLHQILAISRFHRADRLQMCFRRRKKQTFLTKMGEFMKILTLSWELWVSRQPTVLSHGLIFHQCAIHTNLTENALRLKGYEMKGGKKHFMLQRAAKHRHHPPNPLLTLPFCLAPSPILHPFVLFWNPQVRPCCSPEIISLFVTTPAWCISLDIKRRVAPVSFLKK